MRQIVYNKSIYLFLKKLKFRKKFKIKQSFKLKKTN